MKILKHPYEYFAAQVHFAKKMSEVTDTSFEDSMLEYTDLYGSMTEKDWSEQEDMGVYSPIWNKLLHNIEGIEELDEICNTVFEIFQKQEFSHIEIQPREKYIHTNSEDTFGCFSINYGNWNKERQQIKLHFSPMRVGLFEKEIEEQVGDLSTIYLDDRKSEFKELVQYIKDNPIKYDGAKNLCSSTWLQNIPNYQIMFPSKYSLNENREKRVDSFLGLWGQFERWNYTGNTKTYSSFIQNLIDATTREEVINSFPYPVYKILVPLEEMYEYWEIF